MVACRPMPFETRVTTLQTVGVSWLASVAALGAAVILSVTGQGLGALAGGCEWIGAAVPLHRQVWALVNQPVLNFSSLPIAGGYWLGSMALPLLAAVLLVSLRPRRPGLVGRIATVQSVWWIAIFSGIWMPLLDPADGHLSKWLLLHHLQPAWVWVVPAMAVVFVVVATVLMLEAARSFRSNLGPGRRLALVSVHQILPVAVWLYLVTRVGGLPPSRPLLGLAVAATAAVVVGCFHQPSPLPREMVGPSRGAVVALGVGALLSVGLLWVGGQPLAEGRARGLVWGTPESFNNIRPWIEVESLAAAGAEDN